MAKCAHDLAPDMTTNLARLQDWYRAQCNGDWQHSYGIEISTLDNPGWSLTIDLTDTYLQHMAFKAVEQGKIANDTSDPEDWFVCKVEGQRFLAFCGPRNLEGVIGLFLEWARSND